MMPFFLANWKIIIVGILIALVTIFYGLWRHEVTSFSDYKAVIIAKGEAAEIEAKRVEDLHIQTLKEVSHAWDVELPKARSGAVAAYIAAHPPGGLLPRSGSSALSVNASGSQSADATGKECLSTCQPDEVFIADAAEDALKIHEWQIWATDNKLEVK